MALVKTYSPPVFIVECCNVSAWLEPVTKLVKTELLKLSFSVILFLFIRGGFLLSVVPQNDGEAAKVIDFREVAPLAASKDMFHGNESLASWVSIVTAVLHEHNGSKSERSGICLMQCSSQF